MRWDKLLPLDWAVPGYYVISSNVAGCYRCIGGVIAYVLSSCRHFCFAHSCLVWRVTTLAHEDVMTWPLLPRRGAYTLLHTMFAVYWMGQVGFCGFRLLASFGGLY
jgi:hypothetical protein